jgi:hypothetical protein
LIDNFRRLSNLIFSHNFACIFRPVTTTGESIPSSSSDNIEKNPNILTKMRSLRAPGPYALFIKDNYGEISAKYPGKRILMIRNHEI